MPTEKQINYLELGKKRILFVITRGDLIGGAQIHVRDLAQRLKEDGHQVAVALGATGDFSEMLKKLRIPWFLVSGLERSINPLNDLKAVWLLSRILRRFRPDLVSTHTAKAGMVGRLAAFWLGIPALFTVHGWQFAQGIPAWQRLAVLVTEYLLRPLTRRLITVSDYDRRLALEARVASEKNIILIHNGMPWRKVPESHNTEKWKKGSEVRLLMVARFQEQKDHGTLFRALAQLVHIEWKLLLVGEGPDRNKTEDLARTLGIHSRVDFLGQRNDVPEIMETVDIFLLISRWEGFPRSILEAMRASLPVVATNVGGCQESVTLETGRLVPLEDDLSLLAILEELLSNPALCQELGRNGRKRFEDQFSFEALYHKTLTVYKGLI